MGNKIKLPPGYVLHVLDKYGQSTQKSSCSCFQHTLTRNCFFLLIRVENHHFSIWSFHLKVLALGMLRAILPLLHKHNSPKNASAAYLRDEGVLSWTANSDLSHKSERSDEERRMDKQVRAPTGFPCNYNFITWDVNVHCQEGKS